MNQITTGLNQNTIERKLIMLLDDRQEADVKVSIVIPFYNEEDNVLPVLNEILECQPDAEVVAVDDGSSDSTWDRICSIQDVVGIRIPNNRGQSAAMLIGLHNTKHDICVVMDGDGQNDPADIAKMVSNLEQVDAVFGYRQVRKDTWGKRFASKVANRVRRSFFDDGINDTGCSLKVFRKPMLEYLPPFNGLHRFMGAFFAANNCKIMELPVNHRPRTRGASKYNNFNRALRGIYDLIGVGWYINRQVNIKVG